MEEPAPGAAPEADSAAIPAPAEVPGRAATAAEFAARAAAPEIRPPPPASPVAKKDDKKRKRSSPQRSPAPLAFAVGELPAARRTRLAAATSGASAVRRSARRDPTAAAAAAAERSRRAAASSREARARAEVRAMTDEKRRVRRLPAIAFDASGRPADARASPGGLGCWALAPPDAEALRAVHESVKAAIAAPIPWAGGSDEHDVRWRGYGLLPGARRRLGRCLRFHSFETETAEKRRDEEARNWASCVDYAPDAAARRALENVASAAAAAVGPAYAADVAAATLLAVQPNVHAGSRHLPPHLDWPRNDGFGVVIVTAAVKGGATVVLRDGGSATAAPREWRFEVPEGHAYALSGDARNLCTHGLFTDARDRESLNLRFNLHTHKRACDEIYAHWCEGPDAACGPKGPRYL